MNEASAVRAALQLLHMPSSVRFVREAPLPNDLVKVLQIAAREPEALASAEETTGRDGETLVAAARFYIEQVMWHPRADHFRLLGAPVGAATAILKRNLALLMTWLHPDSATPDSQYATHVSRITAAWNDLKTPERRQAYEALLEREAREAALRRRHFKARISANRERILRGRQRGTSLWRRVWLAVTGRPDA